MTKLPKVRVALVGAGAFGRSHARALAESDEAELSGIFDLDAGRARDLSALYDAQVFPDMEALVSNADCAVIATPTVTHEQVATRLLAAGLDVLVEKPIAHSAEAGERLIRLAAQHGRILQVGHLERFNPAVVQLQRSLTVPLFFEIHRLSIFTPRSLDVDVVLDLMIHDLDIVLTSTGEFPNEVRAAGISVLSPLVDIANVRLAFPSGCVANLTASRVSTEKVRKLRLFQPGEYITVDYARQDAHRLAVLRDELSPGKITGGALPVTAGEPLKLELASFLHSVKTRAEPGVTGRQATDALRLAEIILLKIKDHSHLVGQTIAARTVREFES